MLRPTRTGLVVSFMVMLAALARPAKAGCPNVCQIAQPAVAISPALDCASFSQSAETCDCGLLVTMTNNCPNAINAVDFTFNSCVAAGGSTALTQPCPSVAPGMKATVLVRASGDGAKSWPLHLNTAMTDYTATATADVSAFSSGGSSCSVARGEPESPQIASGMWTIVLATLLVIGRRRQR